MQRKSGQEQQKLEMQDFSVKPNVRASDTDLLQAQNREQRRSSAYYEFESFDKYSQEESKRGSAHLKRGTSNFGMTQKGDTPFASGIARKSQMIHSNKSIPTVGGTINRFPIIGNNVDDRAQHSFNQSVQHRRSEHASAIGDVPKKSTFKQRRSKLACGIVTFNYAESVLIFLIMLNAVLFPNLISSIYFIFSLLLVLMAMTRNDQTIKTKFYLSIFMILLPIAIAITKSVITFLMMKNRTILSLTPDDILFYMNFGVVINTPAMTVNKIYTYSYDAVQSFLAIVITIIYRQHYNDVQKPHTQDESTSKLLHPYFDQHTDTLCLLSLIALAIETIFVQTIFQAFILLMLMIKCWLWAFSVIDQTQNQRYLILTFSQALLLAQLMSTFIIQIPTIQVEAAQSDLSLMLDMFGLLLVNIPKYSVFLHQLSITFAITIIQLYKMVRGSMLLCVNARCAMLLGENEEENEERKSDISPNIQMKHIQKPNAKDIRARTLSSGSALKSHFARSSAVGIIREKTMGVKIRINDMNNESESQIHEVAQKYYTHFSPQIWLWTCRAAIFIWAYAYHDYQSWLMLLWLMHSTLFKSTRRFIQITIRYYLPCFLTIFSFYYFINIPQVVQFQTFGSDDSSDPNVDRWRTYGFYKFSIPSLEVALMMIALAPFFFLIKSRMQLEENSKEDTKKKFLERLTDEKSPTLYYFAFMLINNLDLLAFIVIFFSGVNKIDFYHIFLLFFFVAYILWPKQFINNYIILLVYVDFFVFEKYLYTLIIYYIPPDSIFLPISDVLGLATEYSQDSKQKYFKYQPKFQQWLLIIVVFLQYQVHQILKDSKLVQASQNNARDNFKTRYPRLYHFWEIIQHLKKEFLILFSFVIFFMIIIFTNKSIINWGFQIILCVFILTYIGVNNEDTQGAGIKRLQKVWFLIIWYASLILILQITYQFAALPYVREALEIDEFLNMLPTWIRKNIGIIGFTVYSGYIWEKFLIYLIYFAIGVYVRKQMALWATIEQQEHSDNKPNNNRDKSVNSDMQINYFEDRRDKNWHQEYQKIRFSTPYLVYKTKRVWVIFDKISQSMFVLISVMIMILSNYWQISLSMAIHLTCFIGLCLVIASKLYQNRKDEKKKLNNKDDGGSKFKKFLTIEQCGEHWTQYKRKVNVLQVNIRQRVWLFQFVITLLCMVIIYPTEFIYQLRQTFLDEQDLDVVNILNFLIFYLFWGGVYHSPYELCGHWYFYNFYGYVIILILLIFEKNGQQWALNRFGCTQEKAAYFKDVEENMMKVKFKITKKVVAVQEQVIQEENKESDSSISKSDEHSQFEIIERQIAKSGSQISDQSLRSINSQKNSNSSFVSPGGPDKSCIGIDLDESQLKDELKKWIMKKYRLRFLNGFKILLEDTIQLLLLISSVYKDSIIGLILLFGVFIYMMRRKIKQMERLAWIVGLCMILQYGLALSNLTSENNPMDFPDPFNPYPKNAQDEGQFFIPWYRKIALLRENFDWAMYLGMGISNTKLNGLWIDYFVMGMIQTYLLYFGCQLFTVDLKIQKGEYLLDIFHSYCSKVIKGEITQEAIKKETKKLKHEVLLYNSYKYIQQSIFMHFHQVTIVVTLFLAVLARSLFSFGYIIVCMFMIYENHKFFRPEQKDFRLQKVLKFWLQPYVFFDLTLQLVYQIPLDFLHRDQDMGIKWCWQNIIGFQDIWIKDTNNVDEVVVRNIVFIILKAFTYYFVTLQIQVFESTAYKDYIKKDFKQFIDMADTKGMCILWRLNNEKIEKIKLQEEENAKMNEMLDNLKFILKKWQSQYHQDIDAVTSSDQTILQQKQDNLSKISIRETKTQNHADLIDGLGNAQMKPIKAQNISGQQLKNSFSIHQTVDDGKDNEIILKEVISKMSFIVKILFFAKRHLTEQIIFIQSEKYLKRVGLEIQAGRTCIYSKIERKMLSDIRDYQSRLQGDDTASKKIEIKDMKRTQEFISVGGLIQGYLQMIVEAVVTYSDFVCYGFMIMSMLKNAGLISIIYPMVVFGYALMEEVNPKKKVWYAIMIYTELVIMLKFLYQLSFWEAIFWDTQLDSFQDMLNGIHVGLQRKATGAFGEMLAYFLPEILILFAIMSHIQKEIMIGLLYRKEEEVEGIKGALIRHFKFNKHLINKQHSHSPDKEEQSEDYEDYDVEVFNIKFKRDIQKFEARNPNRRNSFSRHEVAVYEKTYEEIETHYQEQQQLGDNQCVVYKQKGRPTSMVGRKELNKIYKELQEQYLIKEDMKTNIVSKVHFSVQWLFYKNQYFQALFPCIKEQKPGKDLYAVIATFQFIICLFLIFFYTKMDADVSNISSSLSYNQFSGQMVIALFIQILVMIIDRYMYKSKTFIAVQQRVLDKTNIKKEQNRYSSIGKTYQKDIDSEERGKSVIEFLQDKNDSDHMSSKSDDIEEQERLEKHISLESTKITMAQVSKFYLQWFLLIFVHLFVFWFFPIHGNEKLQNHPYCVKDADKLGIQCNEFGNNWALIFFYLLYCCYFWLSALQVKFGVPEMKKGNFMMNNYSIVNKIALQGFMAIPFLYELKTFVDWTFTRTALDVFQWFILTATHAELFISRCIQGRYQSKPLGRPIQWYIKLGLGGLGQSGIILLIAGPLLLFSNLNPISTANPVTKASLKFNIVIEPEGSLAKNTINLFTNNYLTQLTSITTEQFQNMSFTDEPRTKSYDMSLVQFIKMNNVADFNWAASQPNRVQLKNDFEKVNSTTSLAIQLVYEFDRANINAPSTSHEVDVDLKKPGMENVLKAFTRTFGIDCDKDKNASSTIFIPPFFTGVHYLSDKDDAIPDSNPHWYKGLRVFFSCQNYWSIDQVLITPNSSFTVPEQNIQNSNLTGVAFYTFSTKIAPSYFRYSIITFYLSIILVISRVFRGVVIIGGNRIFMWEIPNSEKLLLLCECVYIYRMRSQLDQEEQLYFTFIDIMRSPEMIKAITGSSLKKKTD